MNLQLKEKIEDKKLSELNEREIFEDRDISFEKTKKTIKKKEYKKLESVEDRIFELLVLCFGVCTLIIAFGLLYELIENSYLAWSKFGVNFLISTKWDPIGETFGALPFIYGTIVSSFLALFISVPLGIGSAIFLSEVAPKKMSDICMFFIELLAAIPSVVLGIIGIFVLIPFIRNFQPSSGVSMLAASMILSFMILPYITSISRDILSSVPRALKEGALVLGATRWEMITMTCLPYAKSGVISAIFIAFGRALGETMAVTMVIGNTPKISLSLFDPSYTMASVIANELAEATSDIHLHSLIAISLTLFCITLTINSVGRLIINQLTLKKAKSYG